MKLKVLLGVALASLSAFCGTGVTEKRLTNYVGAVTYTLKTNLEAQIEAAMPADYPTVREAALKSATTNALNSAVETLTTAIENATPYDYATVSNRAMISATKVELTQGVSNVMEFIEADNIAAEPTFNADGTITIVHIDYSLGYPKRVPVTLRATCNPYYATNQGFRVISSSWASMSAGKLFAAIDGGVHFYNSTFGQLSYNKCIETNSQQNVIRYYHLYGSRLNAVFDSSNAYLTKQIQVVAYNGTATMQNLLGSFTVEPYFLTDEEFNSVASGKAKGSTNEWVMAEAAPRMLGYKYSWTQISPAVASFKMPPVQERRFSFIDLLFPSAVAASFGAGNSPTEYYQNIPYYPNAPKYDWEELYPNHENDEYWEPRYWYIAADWQNHLAWLSFPITVSIPYEYDGERFTMTKTCSSLAQLQKYFIVNIPPRAYSSPQLKKKKDYCKEGQHIYYNCKCSKCGKKRAHSYDPVAAGATQCAQCKNHNTSTKTDSHGDLMPDTDSGARCTHICDETVVAYHAGWHHEAYDQDEIYNCSCQCGTYSTGKAHLQHTYSDEEEISVWHDAHDGQHHWGKVHCQRGSCNHEKQVYFDHDVEVTVDPETGLPTNVYPFNSQVHQILGDCTKCDAKNLTDHVENHNMIGVKSGKSWTDPQGQTHVATEPFCYCNICWDSTLESTLYAENLHDIFYINCGSIINCIIGCARCDKLIAHNEHDFRTENKYADELYHDCYCGLHSHKHRKNTTSEKCDGGYHWVTEYDDQGQESGGYWVECETYVDDGCEHDWHEDPSHGSKDIPCDSGCEEPDTPNPNGKHIPQGGLKTNPTSNNPWRANGDGCTKHTKPMSTGGYTIEWDDEITLKYFSIGWGGVTWAVIPVQWGTKRFNGSSQCKPKSFRVMRYATWLDWWHNW